MSNYKRAYIRKIAEVRIFSLINYREKLEDLIMLHGLDYKVKGKSLREWMKKLRKDMLVYNRIKDTGIVPSQYMTPSIRKLLLSKGE